MHRITRGLRSEFSWPRALALLCLIAVALCGLAQAAKPAAVPVPTLGSATAEGSSEVNLSWTAPESSGQTLEGYDVYAGTSPGGESTTPVNASPVTTTSLAVTGLTGGTTYCFYVTAVYVPFEGGSTASPPSNELCATTAAAVVFAAPTGLTATAADSSAVNLSWTAPVPSGLTLIGYDVYEGTSPGAESATPLNGTPVTATSYAVTGLTSGATYYFTVTAIYRSSTACKTVVCGEIPSPQSDEASARTGAAVVSTTPAAPPSNEASATTPESFVSTPETQTIRFAPLASRVVNASFIISASASSGLPVSFSSDTPRVCTLSGFTVTTVAAGTCEIRASQSGNADYQPATDITQSFTVSKSQPTPDRVPRTLIAILLAAIILGLPGGALILGRPRFRRHQRSRQKMTPRPSIRAVAHPGPPPVVSIRTAKTEATHSVRTELHTGTRSTTIKEVQS
jgi:hypothetical protein